MTPKLTNSSLFASHERHLNVFLCPVCVCYCLRTVTVTFEIVRFAYGSVRFAPSEYNANDGTDRLRPADRRQNAGRRICCCCCWSSSRHAPAWMEVHASAWRSLSALGGSGGGRQGRHHSVSSYLLRFWMYGESLSHPGPHQRRTSQQQVVLAVWLLPTYDGWGHHSDDQTMAGDSVHYFSQRRVSEYSETVYSGPSRPSCDVCLTSSGVTGQNQLRRVVPF